MHQRRACSVSFGKQSNLPATQSPKERPAAMRTAVSTLRRTLQQGTRALASLPGAGEALGP